MVQHFLEVGFSQTMHLTQEHFHNGRAAQTVAVEEPDGFTRDKQEPVEKTQRQEHVVDVRVVGTHYSSFNT